MSKIEWTERTWNPIVGCSVVSPGCTNCYAMRMAGRLAAMGQERYAGLTKPTKAGAVWTGAMRAVPAALTLPLRRGTPTTWFVNSMSDLFHEGVPDAEIDRVFAVMALCPQHTFQVLTKRSARMRAYLGHGGTCIPIGIRQQAEALFGRDPGPLPITLPNVFLGVSAEDQRRADERVPDLLATPAAVRFVSAEPLLGPIDFTAMDADHDRGFGEIDALRGIAYAGPAVKGIPRLDWVIVGKESGHGARWIDDGPVRAIRDQCVPAGVAFFYKQDARNGRKVPTPELDGVRWTQVPEACRVA